MSDGVYGLVPGVKYRVARAIKDYHGGIFSEGETLTFVSRDYLPYHGGTTLGFEEKTMYLQDDENSDILNAWDTYVLRA